MFYNYHNTVYFMENRDDTVFVVHSRMGLNCYAVPVRVAVLSYPELRFACTGLAMFHAFGVLALAFPVYLKNSASNFFLTQLNAKPAIRHG
jgi:hypothetical protein